MKEGPESYALASRGGGGDVSDPWVREQGRVASLLRVQRQSRQDILVVDDEPSVLRMIVASLAGIDAHVATASNAEQALELVKGPLVDVLIADKNLPGLDGLSLLREALAQRRNIDALIVTGYPSVDSVNQAIEYGAQDYLAKPLRDTGALRQTVTRLLRRRTLTRLFLQNPFYWKRVALDLLDTSPADKRVALGTVAASLQLEGSVAAPRVAVLGEPEFADGMAAAGYDVLRLDKPMRIAVTLGDLDFVAWAADDPTRISMDVMHFAEQRDPLPHLVPIGRFASMDAAHQAFRSQIACLLPRPFDIHSARIDLGKALMRRRLDVAVTALGQLLSILGLSL